MWYVPCAQVFIAKISAWNDEIEGSEVAIGQERGSTVDAAINAAWVAITGDPYMLSWMRDSLKDLE